MIARRSNGADASHRKYTAEPSSPVRQSLLLVLMQVSAKVLLSQDKMRLVGCPSTLPKGQVVLRFDSSVVRPSHFAKTSRGYPLP